MNAWVPWIAVAIAAASLLYTIFNGRSEKNAEKLAILDTKIETKADKGTVAAAIGKLDILEDRATRIETNLAHLPDHKTVNKLEAMIGTLSKDVGVLSERIKPIGAMADRIQEAIVEKVMQR